MEHPRMLHGQLPQSGCRPGCDRIHVSAIAFDTLTAVSLLLGPLGTDHRVTVPITAMSGRRATSFGMGEGNPEPLHRSKVEHDFASAFVGLGAGDGFLEMLHGNHLVDGHGEFA